MSGTQLQTETRQVLVVLTFDRRHAMDEETGLPAGGWAYVTVRNLVSYCGSLVDMAYQLAASEPHPSSRQVQKSVIGELGLRRLHAESPIEIAIVVPSALATL